MYTNGHFIKRIIKLHKVKVVQVFKKIDIFSVARLFYSRDHITLSGMKIPCLSHNSKRRNVLGPNQVIAEGSY